MTAAQAAAASAAGGSGSAGGGGGASGAGGSAGGGGLSTTTIVVAGAAVAGGAVAVTQIAGKAGELKFTGSFSGTITGSFVGGGGNICTYTRTATATARLRFKDHSDSAVSGEFDYDGSATTTASTCPSVPDMPRFIGQVDLTGSPSLFSGRNVFPAPPATGPSGERITGEHAYTFQGSITGDTATGMFKYDENSLSVGGSGGTVVQAGVGTFTITFQKS